MKPADGMVNFTILTEIQTKEVTVPRQGTIWQLLKKLKLIPVNASPLAYKLNISGSNVLATLPLAYIPHSAEIEIMKQQVGC